MKKICFLLILGASLLPHILSAQQQATTTANEVLIKLNDDDFADALADFGKGEARLYCQGGLSPIVDIKKEKRFQRKYKIIYYDLGCVRAGDSFLRYNFAIFELLNFKYGVTWQNLVRFDVIGFEDWKKIQNQ